ncbi:MAG TPA: hypothetical protein VKN18_25255 [Blastocatellia bacterium]|nr:hypothetical protein [Blastocatellia bacterium]
MKKVRRTTLTIQTERLVVMSPSRCLYGLCADCGDEVRLLTVDQASILARVNSRQIYHLVEAGELHFIDSECGLLVCFKSLNGSKLTLY